ncbi:Concanavalin A-like lectin/glucanase, subgroup [Artemisia annua]|uniref:Concanavalin A-like lectin/glucanase, subgroup n=1 Tax=Artemisia annua TaxID=35608 RepID=A0A2U1NQW0_ARTAN|nr:Concanavalin A-like lectin/glucanase, subgroup [Artemisia annua]
MRIEGWLAVDGKNNNNIQEAKAKKDSSFFDIIAKVFTCGGGECLLILGSVTILSKILKLSYGREGWNVELGSSLGKISKFPQLGYLFENFLIVVIENLLGMVVKKYGLELVDLMTIIILTSYAVKVLQECCFSADTAGTPSRNSRKHNYSASSTPSTASGGIQGIDELSFEDIRKATGNFSDSNIIGEGGFGSVYKGKLRNGSVIAIKRAKKDNYDQGTPLEFKNEILTLSQIEHLNLVRFYGYIEHGGERIILLEYVTNGTLREHLDGKCGNGLEIGERLDIMIDVAHAITYLHTYTGHLEPTIEFQYLACLGSLERISELLPLVVIAFSALHRLKQGEVVLAMDPKLRRNPASLMVVEKVLRLARQCLAPTRQLRPSMKKCAEILWRIRKDFHEHNDVTAVANHSVQVPQMDGRKNHRREFFGIEDSSKERFQSA